MHDHSALVKRTVEWVKEFEEDTILATVDPDLIVIIEHWLGYKTITDPKESNIQKYFITPLPHFHHTFPFILVTGYESINMVNVNTAEMQTLIKAPCKNIKS